MSNDEKFMKIAIEEARKGIKEGDRPFGAVLVKNGEVVAKAHNVVDKESDPTAHAELNIIRSFSREIKTNDLSEYILYSTCEPCPMCTSAIAWANIKRVVFGSQRDDFKSKYQRQFTIWPEKFYKEESLDIEIVGGVLRDEILQMYKEYEKNLIYQ